MPEEVDVEPKLYSKQQASTVLSSSEKTVERLIASGALDSTKVGRRRMIFADSIDNLLERARANGSA
jgi:excisionase family DNA binding protein